MQMCYYELGRHRGREGKKECVLCGDECESVSHTLWDCSAYTSIRAQFLLKLKASLGGSYARFEAMSSLDKSSFVLGNELWEEHFESLLALVKAYIIDIWEERKSKLYGDVECAQQPRPHSPTGDLVGLMAPSTVCHYLHKNAVQHCRDLFGTDQLKTFGYAEQAIMSSHAH